MKNKFLLIIILFLLSSCGFKTKDVAYLGENRLVSYFPTSSKVDYLYSFDDLSIHNLYKIVEKNGISLSEKKSIKDIIKKSKSVFISIGYKNANNVINNMNVDILTSEIDLFHYYLYGLIENIKEINKNIFVSSIVIENMEYKTIYILFNQEIEKVCKETKVQYLELNDCEDIKRNLNDIFG